ncbi:MAG: cyclase family protein [Elusimicrobiota bacterium]
MYEFLSYPMAEYIPSYGKPSQKIGVSRKKSLSSGDSCNVFELRFENHWGTHVDCPNHFFRKGMKAVNYPAAYWIFDRPQVVKLALRAGQPASIDMFKGRINNNTDLLILKSGWGKFRRKPVYSLRNPAIHPDTARWLRANYRNLRAVGIDWISVSSFSDRAMGRETHNAFLDPDSPGRPLLLIEDMKIPNKKNKLLKVTALPLIFTNIDSAPCTVIGEYNGK